MERHLADGGEETHWPEEPVAPGCSYDPREEVAIFEVDLENLEEVVDTKDSGRACCDRTRPLEVLAMGNLRTTLLLKFHLHSLKNHGPNVLCQNVFKYGVVQ